MDIRPIRTEDDHKAALAEIDRVWGAPLGTPDGDKLDVLATLVSAYEDQHFPIPEASPLDVLRYAVSDMGRSQAELAEILGSRPRASEILSGKRQLTVEMIAKISAAWRIPAAALIPSAGPARAA